MGASLRKIMFPGLAANVTLNLVMILTFRVLGIGWNRRGIIIDPHIQSKKVIVYMDGHR